MLDYQIHPFQSLVLLILEGLSRLNHSHHLSPSPQILQPILLHASQYTDPSQIDLSVQRHLLPAYFYFMHSSWSEYSAQDSVDPQTLFLFHLSFTALFLKLHLLKKCPNNCFLTLSVDSWELDVFLQRIKSEQGYFPVFSVLLPLSPLSDFVHLILTQKYRHNLACKLHLPILLSNSAQ